MSRLYPEDNRRLNRRFGLAGALASVGIVLAGGGEFLHDEHSVFGTPLWLWLVLLVSGVVLSAIAIAMLLAVRRELRHLRLH
jgi:hypothetical protein